MEEGGREGGRGRREGGGREGGRGIECTTSCTYCGSANHAHKD